jgi:hypothetical protein
MIAFPGTNVLMAALIGVELDSRSKLLAGWTLRSKEKDNASVNRQTVRDWSSPKERGAKKYLRLLRLLGLIEMVLAAPVIPYGGNELYRADNASFK